MQKINLQDLSPKDRVKINNFCKLIAIGMARLEEEESIKAAQANVPQKCEKVG